MKDYQDPKFLYIWKYRVKKPRVKEFEEAYNSSGHWAKLFKESAGYLGTELVKNPKSTLEYYTIDYWDSMASRDEFRKDFRKEFDTMDHQFEALTLEEENMGDFLLCHGDEVLIDGVKMKILITGSEGVVNKETHFLFAQNGSQITASYQGGEIAQGFLVGIQKKNHFVITYCQLQNRDQLAHGLSRANIYRHIESDQLLLIEKFERQDRDNTKTGTNVWIEY